MIPRDYITEWRTRAPWIEDFQVEQDLIISRALVEMFSNSVLAEALAFRGGTALYKLYLTPPARYSEDIDLVQVVPEAAGPVMDAMRSVLDPWLGEAQWKQSRGRVTFRYRVMSEDVAPMRLRLKIEINTRERFTVFGFAKRSFSSPYRGLRVGAGGSGASGFCAVDSAPPRRAVEAGTIVIARSFRCCLVSFM